MADVTITGLPNASALTGAERIPMDQAGTTVDAAASAIAALATKATVGLPLVDNTSDLGKPISTATQAALDTKAATAGTLAQFAATTSAQLAGVVSDETGTGPLVFAVSPIFTTPALGTPSSATLTNATGLPLATGVTGILPVANGGTGTASPGLVAGSNVTISGSWPNQTINATGGGGGGGGDALTTNPLSQFAATTSAQLRGVISDETGTGPLYFQGGDLGTPSSVTLSNGTGLPLSSGISGLGTGIAAALAINTGTAGAPVLFNGAGGTPSALALTNATGLPLATGVTGILPVASGGTGTTSPGLVQGTNITISGAWPNQTISASGGGSFDPASPGAIGGTTAAAGSFTALSASASLLLPNTAGTAARHLYASGDTLRYRDSSNDERLLLNATDNLANLGSRSAARANLELGTAATAAASDFLPTTFIPGTITYAATVDLDMAALVGGYRTVSLTGPLAFTTSNRASGRTVTLRLICDGTARALTFPAGWVFIGAKPGTIAASKTAVLSLTFFGTADADCVAAYGVQA